MCNRTPTTEDKQWPRLLSVHQPTPTGSPGTTSPPTPSSFHARPSPVLQPHATSRGQPPAAHADNHMPNEAPARAAEGQPPPPTTTTLPPLAWTDAPAAVRRGRLSPNVFRAPSARALALALRYRPRKGSPRHHFLVRVPSPHAQALLRTRGAARATRTDRASPAHASLHPALDSIPQDSIPRGGGALGRTRMPRTGCSGAT